MGDEELTLILKLRDQASSQMANIRKGMVVAAAAIAAAGFAMGKAWADAQEILVKGTGASGKALDELQASLQAVMQSGVRDSMQQAATVVADLNTQLGLQGIELEKVAEAALKAGVDANNFGSVAAQMGLDAKGATQFLDQLTAVSQETGVGVDLLTTTIAKNSARFKDAGVSTKQLTDYVVDAAYEFGPGGMRGAMSELVAVVDTGVIPSVKTMTEFVGLSAGAVDSAHEASSNWRTDLVELKNSLSGMLAPMGDVIGSVAGVAAGFGTFFIAFPNGAATVAKLAKAMWFAITGPAGLVIAALVAVATAAYVFRDDIKEAFGIAAESAEDWSVRTGDALIDGNAEFLAATRAASDATNEYINLTNRLAEEEEKATSITKRFGRMKGIGVVQARRAVVVLKKEIAAALENKQALEANVEAVRKGIIADREYAKTKKRHVELSKEAAAAMEKEAKSIAALTRELTGMPTLAAEEDARLLRLAWADLSVEARALEANSDLMAAALERLAEKRIGLTPTEHEIVLMSAYRDAMRELADIELDPSDLEGLVEPVTEAFTFAIPAAASEGGEKARSEFIDKFKQIDIAGTLAKAFQGGGGLWGAVKSLATQVGAIFLDQFGGLLNKGIGGLVAGLFSGGSAAAGGAIAGGSLGASMGGAGAATGGGLFAGFKAGFTKITAAIPGWGWAAAGVAIAGIIAWKAFGGKPSKLEKSGRAAATAARNAIAKTLDDGQVREAAGNMANAVHIAIRDAMLGAGNSIAQAEAQATKFVAELWRAEKEGPKAVAAVKAAIDDLLRGLEDTAAGQEALNEEIRVTTEELENAGDKGPDEIEKIKAELEALTEELVKTNSSLDTAFRSRAFVVTRILKTEGRFGPEGRSEERQHGGPVTAGKPYVVGEAGAELFVPSQSGSIVPGGGSKQLAAEIGKAVARAVQHGINVVIPPDQITDAVLRRTPSRISLRGS